MTHVTEPRVIGNHADMGPSTAKQQEACDDPYTALTVTDVLRAGRHRWSRHRVNPEPESPLEPEGATTAPDHADGSP